MKEEKMEQTELQKESRSNVRTAPKEPRKHNVIILNDDFTTFEFVIEVMMTVFGKTQQQAEEIAEETHIRQKAVVGRYPLDIARSKVAKATRMARAEGYPLKFDIQPEYDINGTQSDTASHRSAGGSIRNSYRKAP